MVPAARALILIGLVACEEPSSSEGTPIPSLPSSPTVDHGADWADVVLEAPGADASVAFGDPAAAANGARGRGLTSGGTDVYSLTLDDTRPYLTLGFSGRAVLDQPGDDLVVFENPFDISGGGRFMDQVIVSVSPDGVAFVAFPVVYGLETYSDDPLDWEGFAGTTPTLLDEDAPDTTPADDPLSGGDRFDLNDLPSGDLRDQILARGAVAVRMTSVALHVDPITERPFPTDPVSNGPDIDAVYAWTFGAR